MRSFLFCTTYIDNARQDQQTLRYQKWLEYYSVLMEALGVDHMFMIDDGSPHPLESDLVTVISADSEWPAHLPARIHVIRFDQHLGRIGNDYAGWWRSFTYAYKIAAKYGFDKIIHIESDFYVVSPRLRAFIREMNEGWMALYSAYYRFPETAIQVICKDCFDLLEGIYIRVRESGFKLHDIAENVLPFTVVRKDFIGDRLGEDSVRRHWAQAMGMINLDYVGQLPAHEDLSGLLDQLRTGRSGS
jgi:hypothetical protein